jgi:hypothetical protein
MAAWSVNTSASDKAGAVQDMFVGQKRAGDGMLMQVLTPQGFTD